MNGNKSVVNSLIRSCHEEFRAAKGENYSPVFELYQLAFETGRESKIIDDKGLRALNDHEDDWRSQFAARREVLEAVREVFTALRNTLSGHPEKDWKDKLRKLDALVSRPAHQLTAADTNTIVASPQEACRHYWQMRAMR